MVTVLVRSGAEKLLAGNSFTIHYTAGPFAKITCPLSVLSDLYERGTITHAELGAHGLKLLNDTMVYRNRVKSVKVWTSPLPQAYNGEGVILGFIDTGIDFKHKDFIDSSGKSRLMYLWDQAAAGAGPPPFNYGTEWTAAQIDANQCTHSDLVYAGHGTQVAGVAAGNGRASGHFEGVASKASIIMVAADFSNPYAILDGAQYIFQKASQLGLPCVINISLGDYYGSHDGTDFESQMIDAMITGKPGRAVVAAVGNAGNYKFHAKTKPSGDTVFTWFSSTGTFDHHCYADTADMRTLKIRMSAFRSGLSRAGSSVFYNFSSGLNNMVTDTVKNANGQRLGLVRVASYINSAGVYDRYFEVEPDSASMVWGIETAGYGVHHAWNFDLKSTGLPALSQYPRMAKYVMPDSCYSMVTGLQCSEQVITVANYVNLYRYYDVRDSLRNATQPGGAIAYNSSTGPTRDGRVKPDITATGDYMFTAFPLPLLAGYVVTNPEIVAQGSMHILTGGSSASSPVVAGLAALYLQKNPGATPTEIRDAIRYCAYHDGWTGSQLPDYRWGFGKLDGKAAMLCLEPGVFSGVGTAGGSTMSVFPNPFTGSFTIKFSRSQKGWLRLFSSSGVLIQEELIDSDTHEVNLKHICPGLIVARFEGEEVLTFKIINE
jgi:subtilisin family serine protease